MCPTAGPQAALHQTPLLLLSSSPSSSRRRSLCACRGPRHPILEASTAMTPMPLDAGAGGEQSG